jgi:hypothetical protein
VADPPFEVAGVACGGIHLQRVDGLGVGATRQQRDHPGHGQALCAPGIGIHGQRPLIVGNDNAARRRRPFQDEGVGRLIQADVPHAHQVQPGVSEAQSVLDLGSDVLIKQEG